MTKILVTGAAGFIGSHLCERLVAAGHQVTGVDCFNEYYDPELKRLNAKHLAEAGISLHETNLADDWLNGSELSGSFSDFEVIYHFAAQPGNSPLTPFSAYLENNIVATQNLLAACREQETAPFFVNVATSSVYGAHATDSEEAPPKPTSPYGVTKLAAEQLVLAAERTENFSACSIRIFSVIGPRERPDKLYHKLIRAILNDQPFPLFEGSEKHSRTFTYVGDAVDAFVALLDHRDIISGEIFNIGSDTEITTGDGMAMIEELLGKKAIFERKPPRLGDQIRTAANIEKARRLLQWEPTTPPREALKAEVDWYLGEIHEKINVG